MASWPRQEEIPISCTSIMRHYMGKSDTFRLPLDYGRKSSVSAVRRFAREPVACWKRVPKWIFILLAFLHLIYYWKGKTKTYVLHQDTFRSRLMPLRFWQHQAMYPEAYRDGSFCGTIPSGHDLIGETSIPLKEFWQKIPLNGGYAIAYSAYWDSRGKASGQGVVRILMYSIVSPFPKMYCQLWYFRSAVPFVVEAQPLYAGPEIEKPIYGASEPYIFTCDPFNAILSDSNYKIPRNISSLAAVSVVQKPCEKAKNIFNILNFPISDEILRELDEDYRKTRPLPAINSSIAVCAKMGNNHQDISTRLAEWFQMLKRFGVSKVYIYMMQAHENVLRTIAMYERSGFVDVTPLMLPPMPAAHSSYSPSVQRYLAAKTQLMQNNDCLYRVLGKHQWITILDIDQIIVPMTDITWKGLAKRVKYVNHDKNIDGITFDTYFFPKIDQAKREAWLINENKKLYGPPGFAILRDVWRTRNKSDKDTNSRSLFNVQTVLACHDHQPLWCISDDIDDYTDDLKENYRACNIIKAANDMGRLHQYRGCQYSEEFVCDENDLVKDDALVQRYGADVIYETLINLKILGIFKDSTSTTPRGNL